MNEIRPFKIKVTRASTGMSPRSARPMGELETRKACPKEEVRLKQPITDSLDGTPSCLELEMAEERLMRLSF